MLGRPSWASLLNLEASVDQQRECNEYEELRELLKEVLRAQEQILRRLELLEKRISPSVRD